MTDLDRAERRRRRKALVASGQKHIKAGLQKRSPRDVLAVAALAVADEAKTPSDLAAGQHAAYETASRIAAPTAKIACKKGCNFCCHQRVLVSAPEAFLLAKAARAKGPTFLLEAKQRAEKIADKSADARLGAKLPCALLVNGTCSVYAERPLNCRQVTSFAVEPCRDEFEGKPSTVNAPAHYALHAENTRILEATALLTMAKPVAFYELGAALLRIFETPDAESKWLAGNDIFHGLVSDSAVSGAVEAEARVTAGLLGRALDGANVA
jgi:Fe-S-cluster containining protein